MDTRYDTQSFQSYGHRLQTEARRARPATAPTGSRLLRSLVQRGTRA